MGLGLGDELGSHGLLSFIISFWDPGVLFPSKGNPTASTLSPHLPLQERTEGSHQGGLWAEVLGESVLPLGRTLGHSPEASKGSHVLSMGRRLSLNWSVGLGEKQEHLIKTG